MTLPTPVLLRRGRLNGRIVWWLAVAALFGSVLLPLMVVDVPPLLDYPNHLARVFVLSRLPADAILARFYAPHWSVIPDLALDLVGPPLMRILPVYDVGRLLISAAVMLPMAGAICCNVALGGRWWGLGAGLVAYNSCLLYGFLNFEISLGLALLLAAAWLRWRETRPAAAVLTAAVGAPLLFACHLMGLVFFGSLIGGAELSRLRRDPASLPRRAGLLAVVFAVPLLLYSLSALRSLGGDAEFLPMGAKLLQLVTTFVNYDWSLDLVTAGAVILIPAIALLLRKGRLPGPAAVTMVLLLLVFLVSPYGWKGTFMLDTRLAIMLAFMLFAGFVPVAWPPAARRAVAVLLVTLFVVRMAILTTAFAAHRTDLAALRTVLAPVQPGQTVYVAEVGLKEAPAYWAANPGWRLLSNGIRTDEHLGALVLIEHRAWWPFEFDNVSQQPIETRQPFQSLARRVGHLPDLAETEAADLCDFDYVLLTGADAVPELSDARVRLLTRSGFAALYRVAPCKEKHP